MIVSQIMDSVVVVVVALVFRLLEAAAGDG